MLSRLFIRAIAASITSLCLFSPAYAAFNVEDEFARTIKLILSKSFVADWQGIEKLPGIKWAPLPPTMLQNCLPDGGCFTRQGMLATEGRNLAVIATGARTIVTHIYFRNSTTAIGEAAVLTALKQEGLSAEFARCPVRGSLGGTNWYRLNGMGIEPGYLSVQTSCNGKSCEGFSVSLGEDLPPLQPNQLSLYSEKCWATDPGDRDASLHRDASRTIGANDRDSPSARIWPRVL